MTIFALLSLILRSDDELINQVSYLGLGSTLVPNLGPKATVVLELRACKNRLKKKEKEEEKRGD